MHFVGQKNEEVCSENDFFQCSFHFSEKVYFLFHGQQLHPKHPETSKLVKKRTFLNKMCIFFEKHTQNQLFGFLKKSLLFREYLKSPWNTASLKIQSRLMRKGGGNYIVAPPLSVFGHFSNMCYQIAIKFGSALI